MASRPGVVLLLLAALTFMASASKSLTGRKGAEFAPSVVLTNMGELASQCTGMVDRSAALNAKNIKIVPTVHYRGSEDAIQSYCFRNEWGGCDDVTPQRIKQFQDLLAKCFKHAVAKGLNVGVLAHLDNSVGYTWRNLLQFSPTQKYGGYTYNDVVLKPISKALAQSINKNTEVVFTLQGETGKSVSQHASQWLGLIKQVKDMVKAGGKAGPGKVLVGISMNYNKVYGWQSGICWQVCYKIWTPITRQMMTAKFESSWKANISKYPMDLPAMKKLYEAVDVIGISAYPPLKKDFLYKELEQTLEYHAYELGFANINLKKLIDSGKKVVISEWGVGGGNEAGTAIAANVTDVAGLPFFGLWYPYSDARNPWANKQFNDYRYKFFKQHSGWLKNKGGPTYRVDTIYMWNAGSWDATGVHYTTPSPRVGGWADPNIITLVKRHNKYVNS